MKYVIFREFTFDDAKPQRSVKREVSEDPASEISRLSSSPDVGEDLSVANFAGSDSSAEEDDNSDAASCYTVESDTEDEDDGR